MYSELVREHYLHPRNVGTLPNPSGKAMVQSPFDSDTLLVTLKIEDNKIADIRFKCVGCPIAIASSSIATETVMDEQAMATAQPMHLNLTVLDDVSGDLQSDKNRVAIHGLFLSAFTEGLEGLPALRAFR